MAGQHTGEQLKRVGFKWAVGGWGLMLFLITPMIAVADENQDEPPSEAFLEFLGEWEDAQGNWQDPLDYVTPEDELSAQGPDTNVEQNDETP